MWQASDSPLSKELHDQTIVSRSPYTNMGSLGVGREISFRTRRDL